MSDTGEFRFNLQNIIEKGIVSPAYPVFKVKEEYSLQTFLNFSLTCVFFKVLTYSINLLKTSRL